MRPYTQVTSEERFALSLLRRQGLGVRAIARVLTRAPSPVSREVRRNVWHEDRRSYLPGRAQSYTNHRRRRSRRNTRFTAADWAEVEARLRQDWSPEQIAGRLRRTGQLAISHETIYRHVWTDWRHGGTLRQHLRGARKQRRKRYGAYDSRGRVTGKRPLSERSVGAARRSRFGHWEGDTVLGNTQHGACIVTVVERKSGFTAIGRLRRRAAPEVNVRLWRLLAAQPRPVHSLTLDNGTEFHRYRALEARTAVACYFATPHHAWERGTNENTNGLIRQYLPKHTSMEHLTQRDCQRIADTLNRRPRKRLGFRTPEEVYVP
jgi:IS30 family transposase